MVLLSWIIVGCRDRIPPAAPTTGTYGRLDASPSTNHAPRLLDRSATEPWKTADLAVIQSDLSPATLLHTTARSLTLFAEMPATGLGAPTHFAAPTMTGPKIFKAGDLFEASRLNESWLVTWFSGAMGWTHWDSPWLITLQRKPVAVRLNTNGLAFEFSGPGGYTAIMPLYGYDKLAAQGEDFPNQRGVDEKKKNKTWDWVNGLARDPLARARYWTCALKEFPIHCEDQFRIDRSRDSVIVRQRIRYLSWTDDWNTRSMKLAPVNPVLAHAFRERFPAQFSMKPFDMEIFTPHGPYYGIENAEEYAVSLPVLRSIHEAETLREAPATNQFAIAAQERLRTLARTELAQTESRRSVTELLRWAQALPVLDDSTRTNLSASLARSIREKLQTDQLAASRRAGPLFETLWTYSHNANNWELAREHWSLVRQTFMPGTNRGWPAFGHRGDAAIGHDTAACLAMARLAYRLGDADTYQFAAQQFARELAVDWIKLRGAAYFRLHQPYQSLAELDERAQLMSLSDHPPGWIFSAETTSSASVAKPAQRWNRFHNPDVARFYRDYLQGELTRELERVTVRRGEGEAAGDPWLTQANLLELRSLLLPPRSAASLSNLGTDFNGSTAEVAVCLATLRSAQAPRYERLIPGDTATSWQVGVERDAGETSRPLLHVLVTRDANSESPTWPRLTWPAWRTETGAAWNFGTVRVDTNRVNAMESVTLNWNSSALLYHLP